MAENAKRMFEMRIIEIVEERIEPPKNVGMVTKEPFFRQRWLGNDRFKSLECEIKARMIRFQNV
jgi:hypothetical protein